MRNVPYADISFSSQPMGALRCFSLGRLPRRLSREKRSNVNRTIIVRSMLLALLWLCGACLRLTILAIPPVVPLLHADLHLSETGLGWLSSLPPMLFALAAVPGSLLIARFGLVPAVLVGLLLNAIGSAARGAVPSTIGLYAATVVMAAGVSIMQPA